MPTFRTHLSDQVVVAGKPLHLAVAVDGGDEGVGFSWQHDNEPVDEATGPSHVVDRATAAESGTWTVVASKDGTSASSSATVIVMEPVPATELPPPVWRKGFATVTAWVLGFVVLVVGLPLVVRAWTMRGADRPAGAADAAIVASLATVVGIVLLAVTAYAVLVEVRGRSVDPPADTSQPAGAGTTSLTPEGLAKVIDAVGALRGIQLLAVSGLLALGLAGLLGWRLATPSDPATDPAPGSGAEATPGENQG